jgi:hypothetical protein
MTSTEWEETKIILHELEQLFHREDDIKDILDIKKMEKEILSQCSNRVGDVREIIKGEDNIQFCLTYLNIHLIACLSSLQP